jgi:flavin reductase (DIM6/NTAB) family NADH-FMN oxidoreductase RutF
MTKNANMFSEITPEEMLEMNTDLFGEGYPIKGFPVITAKSGNTINSMVGSGGGIGTFMKYPAAWNLIRADRYTLEIIKDAKAYTISYFTKEHQSQIIPLGRKSGRDSAKMQETTLTPFELQSGSIGYNEAELIIDCSLLALPTINETDLYSEELLRFVADEYTDIAHYRQVLFGKITAIYRKERRVTHSK